MRTSTGSARSFPEESSQNPGDVPARWAEIRPPSTYPPSRRLLLPADPAAGLRSGGVDDTNAARTVRRCTLWKAANSRIDISLASRRIRSSCSTFDLTFNPFLSLALSDEQRLRVTSRMGPNQSAKNFQSGAISDCHTQFVTTALRCGRIPIHQAEVRHPALCGVTF